MVPLAIRESAGANKRRGSGCAATVDIAIGVKPARFEPVFPLRVVCIHVEAMDFDTILRQRR
jgi:hypothetical protein